MTTNEINKVLDEQTVKIENVITDISTGKDHMCWTIKTFTDFSMVMAFKEDLWRTDFLYRQSFCIFDTLQRQGITEFKITESYITKKGFEGLNTKPLEERFNNYIGSVFLGIKPFNIDKCKELIIQHKDDLQNRL